jgi:hypothetical protein
VRYHAAIDPSPFRTRPEDEALPALLAELQRRVDRSLLPGVKADERMTRAYRSPAPAPRLHELAGALVVAVVLVGRVNVLLALLPSLAYASYLALDRRLVPQSRLAKWVRNASSLAFAVAVTPLVLRATGAPAIAARAAWLAMVAASTFPYLYERGFTAIGFLRGMTLALALEWGAQALVPAPAGAHAALAACACAFALMARTVYWRYAAAILAAWAVGVPWILGWTVGLALHFAAGLVAAAVALAFPYRPRRRARAANLAPASTIG